MKKLLILYALLAGSLPVWAQEYSNFKPLRYNDDFSYIASGSAKSWYEKIKHMSLSSTPGYYISAGGEARWQYTITKNNMWGDAVDVAGGYLLSRYLFHTDIHIGTTRIFGQFQSSLATHTPNPSPVDRNPAEIHQAFVDVGIVNKETARLFVRLGRQEMLYGSQRLIGVREGPNSRISFDAVKAVLQKKRFQADLFYTHPVANIPGNFNDQFNDNAMLWGNYTVLTDVPFFNAVDLYYLGLWKNKTSLDNISGRELRHSGGTRIWKNKGNWRYDIEMIYQFGQLADKDVSAWTISSNISYRFENVKFSPVAGIKTEIISGDKNRNDSTIQTFNPLYPRGAYFGQVALIGPSNLFDIHPSVDLRLTKKLSFGADYDIFWRWSENDGVYAPNMQLLYSGEGIKQRHIGRQLLANLEYLLNPYCGVKTEGGFFKAGSFLKQAGSGKNYFYFSFTAAVKF